MVRADGLSRRPFICSYNKTARKVPGKGGLRYYKSVGLGFKTPKEAIEGKSRTRLCGGAVRRGSFLPCVMAVW